MRLGNSSGYLITSTDWGQECDRPLWIVPTYSFSTYIFRTTYFWLNAASGGVTGFFSSPMPTFLLKSMDCRLLAVWHFSYLHLKVRKEWVWYLCICIFALLLLSEYSMTESAQANEGHNYTNLLKKMGHVWVCASKYFRSWTITLENFRLEIDKLYVHLNLHVSKLLEMNSHKTTLLPFSEAVDVLVPCACFLKCCAQWGFLLLQLWKKKKKKRKAAIRSVWAEILTKNIVNDLFKCCSTTNVNSGITAERATSTDLPRGGFTDKTEAPRGFLVSKTGAFKAAVFHLGIYIQSYKK